VFKDATLIASFMHPFQVLREEEFAPVKNANGSNYDTPDSAKMLVFRLHTRWVVAAGGFLTHSVPLYATGEFSLFSARKESNYNHESGVASTVVFKATILGFILIFIRKVIIL
jgi:UDP-N-acetylglucosamine pyrophosphorylase